MQIISISTVWMLLVVCTTPTAKRDLLATDSVIEQPALIDREVFFGDPKISNAAISPDGRFITFIKPYHGVANLYVKARGEPFEAARPLTAATRPLGGYSWTRDSRFVLVRQDRGGDENFHIFAVDPAAAPEPATGVPAARDLTPGEAVRASVYARPASQPDALIVGLNDRDPKVSDVYRLSISTGKKTLLVKNTENIEGWEVDLAGTVRVGERTNAAGEHEVLRVDGSTFTPIYRCAAEETCDVSSLNTDGTQVYLITNGGGHDLTQLTLVDLASGRETFVEEDPEHQVDVDHVIFSSRNELLATMYQGDRVRVYPHDPVFANDLAALRRALPTGDFAVLSRTSDESVALVGNASDVDPGAVYVYERATGTVELLFRPLPQLAAAKLAPMQPVRITARDGVELSAYLTVPVGAQPSDQRPAVVLVHGGPWLRDEWGYNGEVQFLANRGYVVLQVNFRGSTGFGKKFLNLGNGQWGTGAMQHDLTDATRWLVGHGLADGKRVAIMGGSYGGFATLAGLAFTPDLYAAGIDIVGPSNLMTLLSTIPPYWAPARKMFSLRVGDLESDVERLKHQSPLFSAQNITAPLLVVQGANDPRVKQAEADQIVHAMASLSRPVEYLVAPDEGHGFAGKLNRLAMYVAVERFLGQHLGGRVQPTVTPDVAERVAALKIDPASVAAPVRVEPRAPAVFNSANFKPGPRFRYRVAGELGGQKVEGSSTLTVTKAPAGWVVSTVDSLPQGVTTDLTTLSATSLLPTGRTIKQGEATVQLAYAEHSVSGQVAIEGKHLPLQGTSERPLVTDGLTLGLAVATLPLADGYTVGLGSFDASSGHVDELVLVVKGTEQVSVPAGRFEAFRIEISPEDASSSTTLWVEKAAAHRVLKQTQRFDQNQSLASELLGDGPRGSSR